MAKLLDSHSAVLPGAFHSSGTEEKVCSEMSDHPCCPSHSPPASKIEGHSRACREGGRISAAAGKGRTFRMALLSTMPCHLLHPELSPALHHHLGAQDGCSAEQDRAGRGFYTSQAAGQCKVRVSTRSLSFSIGLDRSENLECSPATA